VCIGLSVVATVAAQLVAYPMYTVKSCLQSGMPHPGATVMQCTTAILKERGALGTFEHSCIILRMHMIATFSSLIQYNNV
jgi:hypothetical protein